MDNEGGWNPREEKRAIRLKSESLGKERLLLVQLMVIVKTGRRGGEIGAKRSW